MAPPGTEPPPARRRLRPTRTRQPPPRDPDRQADHHGTDSDRERLRDDRRHSAADPDCHDGTRPMAPTIVKDDGHLSIRSYTLKQNTHSHAFHQIVIPLNGAIDIAFEGQHHTVGVGHCIVIRSGTVHSYSAPEQSRFLVADTARCRLTRPSSMKPASPSVTICSHSASMRRPNSDSPATARPGCSCFRSSGISSSNRPSRQESTKGSCAPSR